MFPNLSAEMARRRLTNKTLADILGVSEKTVANWKGGKTEVPASKLLAMARLFNCTVDYLLSNDMRVTQ